MKLLKTKATQVANVAQTKFEINPLELQKYVAWRTSQTLMRLKLSQTNKPTDAAKGPEGSAAAKGVSSAAAERSTSSNGAAKQSAYVKGASSAVMKGGLVAANRSAVEDEPDEAVRFDAESKRI